MCVCVCVCGEGEEDGGDNGEKWCETTKVRIMQIGMLAFSSLNVSVKSITS